MGLCGNLAQNSFLKSCPHHQTTQIPITLRFKQYKAVRQGRRLNLHHTIQNVHESQLVVLLRPGQLQTSHLPTGRRKLELKVAR